MRNLMIALVCLLPVLIAGCAGEPPPPPPPPTTAPAPPPEPTPEEIYQMLSPIIVPFREQLQGRLSPEPVMLELIAKLRTEKTKYTGTDNGRQALSRINTEIADMERQGKKDERWWLVKFTIEALDVLDPGAKTNRYKKDYEYAQMMLNKPNVKVTGFLESGDEIYVWVKVTDPVTHTEDVYKIREGEEFHTRKNPDKTETEPLLQMLKIIGDKHAVEFLYKEANITWKAFGPNETRSE